MHQESLVLIQNILIMEILYIKIESYDTNKL
jgi:hypothetical protein